MGKIRELLDQQRQDYKDILKRYTATIAEVCFTCVLYVIINTARMRWTDVITDIFLFLSVTALGFLFTETVIKGKEKKGMLILFYILSLIDAGLWVLVAETLGSSKNDTVLYYTAAVFGLYLLLMFGKIFLEWVKESGIPFEKYMLRMVFTFMKIFLILLILNVGLIIIIVMINSLLIKIRVWMWISNMEVLLAGIVYVPFVLICLTRKDEERSKFVRGLLLYVFIPLLLISMAIIYLYMIKIVVTWKFPSNEVFAICAGLFCGGLCVWTLSYAYIKEDADNKYYKIIKYLKYIYAPFIILECICLFSRIGQYGFTFARYCAVWFIAAQVIYILWEPLVNIFRRIFKKEPIGYGEHYEWLVYVGIAIYILVILVPFTQALHVEYTSQRHRFEEAREAGDTKGMHSIYRVLRDNMYGEKYLEENYDIKALEEEININPWESASAYEWIYIYAGNEQKNQNIDISGYSTLSQINYYMTYDEMLTPNEIKSVEIEIGKTTKTVDLTDTVEAFAKYSKERDEEDHLPYYVKTPSGDELVIYTIRFEYEEKDNQVRNLYINGIWLEK